MSLAADINAHLQEKTVKPSRLRSFLKSLTISDWGVVGAGIMLTAASFASYYDHKHERASHEYRNTDTPLLYATAPARQALRKIIANQHLDDRANAESLVEANVAVNTCLEEYQSHVTTLIHQCRSYNECLLRFSTTDEDDNVVFNPNSGLGGVTSGFYVNSRQLMNIDINRGPTSYILTEDMSSLTILPHKVEQSLRRHRAQLEACRNNIVLVDQSLAALQGDH